MMMGTNHWETSLNKRTSNKACVSDLLLFARTFRTPTSQHDIAQWKFQMILVHYVLACIQMLSCQLLSLWIVKGP